MSDNFGSESHGEYNERNGRGDRGGQRQGNGRGGRGGASRAGGRSGRDGERPNGRGRGGRSHGHGDRDRGENRDRRDRLNPQRQGFREDRMNQKLSEPDLPDEIDVKDLDLSVLQDLRVLSKENADRVAKHMIMASMLIDDDPQLALRHARAAKNRAGRVGVVRETNGIIAYHAGEWKEALAELRAARRMLGGPGLLAVMADAERGLGRPEKALEIGRGPEAEQLDKAGRIELGIVLAGARHDLGQHEAALATLQKLHPSLDARDKESARLSYAYADALLALDRKDEARRWFEHVAKLDADAMTDARARVEELS